MWSGSGSGRSTEPSLRLPLWPAGPSSALCGGEGEEGWSEVYTPKKLHHTVQGSASTLQVVKHKHGMETTKTFPSKSQSNGLGPYGKRTCLSH